MSRYLTAAEEKLVVARYQAGETAREIAASIGKTKTTILAAVRRQGLQPRAAVPRQPMVGDRNPNWKGGRYIDPDGYVHVWTPTGHKREHRVIAGAEPGTVVHHRDGNPLNNDPANLEVLPSNAAHHAVHVAEQRAKKGKANHPPPMPGEANPRSKLTREQVFEIRRARGIISQSNLAAKFGVTKTAIRYIQQGRNWKSEFIVSSPAEPS